MPFAAPKRKTNENQNPLTTLIESLERDGLSEEARQLNVLFRQVAWTTGSEFLAELGRAMKALKVTHWNRMSDRTKTCFGDAAAAVRKAWPQMKL